MRPGEALADVYLTNQAKKFLKNMQKSDYEPVLFALELMRQVPVPFREYDIKKVSGFENTYRIRVGRFRMIYELEPREQVIVVLKIDRKKDSTYKRL